MKKISKLLVLISIATTFFIADLTAQTMMPIPTPTSSYSGMTRGYYFLAPCNFNIVGLKVPTNFSTANSYIAVLDFGTTPPPTYSGTTNAFTTLIYLQNVAGTGIITVNQPIISGHYIGIMGCRGSLSNYTGASPSYATSINGLATTLYRMGMQYDLTTTAPQQIWTEASTVAVCEMYYSTNLYAVDAGMSAIDSPAVNIIPGNHLISVKIVNSGNDTLKSVNINWSFNGAIQTPFAWTGALIKNQISGSVTINPAFNFQNGTHTLKFWTSDPNGKADSNKYNDTLKTTITVCNVLNGTLVVDKSGNGNFPDIKTAINALAYCGINGPTTLKIKSGTYTERVKISAIPGVNATNTLTIDGGSPDSTKIVYSTTSSTEYAVIALNGADYITIKNLTLENTNATYACGVHIGNAANYNTIENCVINLGVSSTSSSAVPIIGSATEAGPTTYGDGGNYNTIKNCRLIGGYYGLRWYGLSSSPYSLGNKFIGNTIEQFYYYGAMLYYHRNILFQNNKVIKPRYAYAYGLYAYYVYNSIYDGNTINPGVYGMMIYYNQNSAPDSSVISNNIISNFMNGSYQTGFYVYSSWRCHFLNNSVWTDGTYSSTTSYGCVYNYSTQNCVFKNNIFKSTGNLPCMAISGASYAAGSIDYNNYFVSSTAYVAYAGGTYTTLALWKAADQTINTNSISVEPLFVDYKDLHLQTSSPRMLGIKNNLQYDVDGDRRCDISTTMGADEFHYLNMPPTAGYVAPDTTCENSPLQFWNIISANEVTQNKWWVNSVLKATTLNFSYTPATTGVDTVTVSTRNCFGADTFSRTVMVVSPSQAPVTDFVASRNRAKIGELVKLNDLSVGCPSSWQWKIQPDTVLDLVTGLWQPAFSFQNGTNYSSQNPEVVFNYSGLYTVNLKTTNSIGVGNTETKNDYLSVVPALTMCFGSTTTEEPEGFLYDNGGRLGNYTANKLCNFTIHPCASTVTMSFPKFNLSSGDFLRIYDGTDKTGTPLWNKKTYPYGMGNAVSASFPKDKDEFVAQSGSLYIEFETDASFTAEGFEAVWSSTSGTFDAPVASFNVQDSNCNGSYVFFENTSTGEDNKNFWDFDGDGNFESQTTNPNWIYKTDGNYNVRLAVINCGGSDTIDKNILIFTNTNQPSIDLDASNYHPNLGTEIVYLTGFASAYCVDTFSWSITPKSYTVKTGNLHDYTVGITFNDTVCYDVQLISGYQGMMDTMVKTCLVRPIEYCIPNFTYTTPDIGISRVKVGSIDQVSESGVRPYEDFTTLTTSLMEYGVLYHFTVERNSSYNYIQRRIWIDYNIDGDFNDAGEMIAYDSSSKSQIWTGAITVPNTASPGKTRMRVGVAAVNQPLGPCSILNNGEYEDYSVQISPIITPPVITLTGNSKMLVPECGSFSDPGATAYDVLGNPVTVDVTGTVDPKVPSVYTISYNATDQFGNKAVEKTRSVVVEPDNVVPIIQLIGKKYDTVVVHNSYTDPGYTSFDTCSGLDKVNVSSSLDIQKLGTYNITYESIDKRGNTSVSKRYIEVIDNIPPVIQVFDPDTIFIEVNTELYPRVLKITDNYYDVFSIITSGTFYQNFNTGLATSIGIYTIIYDVYDGSGNKSSKTFWIEVGDHVKPVIVLNGSRMINICRYDTIVDDGYVVEDNVDANPDVIRSGSYFTDYLVNFNHGIFEIQYKAIDNSNNYAYISRLIYVSDTAECYSSITESQKNTFRVYPNPSKGLVNIDLHEVQSGSVQVFSILGKMVYSREYKNSKQIQLDLGELESGIYSIRWIGNGVKYHTNINILR